MNATERTKIVHRLKRIEGQIRGLEKLVENGAPGIAVLTQVSAVTSAIKKAGAEFVRAYMDQCLSEIPGKSEANRVRNVKEFQKALSRFIDMA